MTTESNKPESNPTSRNSEPKDFRFSIIIPVRNLAGELPKLMSSIAKQTYNLDDVQVIVVDDASDDATPYIAEKFGEELPNFKLIRNPIRKCAGGARNAGLRVATGEYIFFNDADDTIFPKSLELINKALVENGDPDVCLFPFIIDRDTNESGPRGLFKPNVHCIQDAVKTGSGAWTCVFKRSLAVLFPENVLSEDVPWHFLQFDKFNSMAMVQGDEPCYYYNRKAANAITNTNIWASKPRLLEDLALENLAIKAGKNDKWISDVLRNTADMYDIRHKLTKPWVIAAWKERFAQEARNLRIGIFTL